MWLWKKKYAWRCVCLAEAVMPGLGESCLGGGRYRGLAVIAVCPSNLHDVQTDNTLCFFFVSFLSNWHIEKMLRE